MSEETDTAQEVPKKRKSRKWIILCILFLFCIAVYIMLRTSLCSYINICVYTCNEYKSFLVRPETLKCDGLKRLSIYSFSEPLGTTNSMQNQGTKN